jgi:biotin transport system substrate-specific component
MKRFGSLPVLIYIGLGILNMPVFHNGLGGIGILLGPTGGYLIGFIPAATIVGFAYERPSKVIRITGIIAATMIIYVIGIGWLLISTGISFAEAIAVGFLLFIPGDILKGTIAYLTAQRLT